MRPNSKKISKPIYTVVTAGIRNGVHFAVLEKYHFVPADTADEMQLVAHRS